MNITMNNAASTAAAALRGRPGINVAHTAGGRTAAVAAQIPVSTEFARLASSAMIAPRGVGSGFSRSLTGATASAGMPSPRRKRSRPVIDPK